MQSQIPSFHLYHLLPNPPCGTLSPGPYLRYSIPPPSSIHPYPPPVLVPCLVSPSFLPSLLPSTSIFFPSSRPPSVPIHNTPQRHSIPVNHHDTLLAYPSLFLSSSLSLHPTSVPVIALNTSPVHHLPPSNHYPTNYEAEPLKSPSPTLRRRTPPSTSTLHRFISSPYSNPLTYPYLHRALSLMKPPSYQGSYPTCLISSEPKSHPRKPPNLTFLHLHTRSIYVTSK